jgi:hypothetical protein
MNELITLTQAEKLHELYEYVLSDKRRVFLNYWQKKATHPAWLKR